MICKRVNILVKRAIIKNEMLVCQIADSLVVLQGKDQQAMPIHEENFVMSRYEQVETGLLRNIENSPLILML